MGLLLNAQAVLLPRLRRAAIGRTMVSSSRLALVEGMRLVSRQQRGDAVDRARADAAEQISQIGVEVEALLSLSRNSPARQL
jgi:hypothetical protein